MMILVVSHIKLTNSFFFFPVVANLLFVESPVGVGFSYTNTTSDLTKLDYAFVGNTLVVEVIFDIRLLVINRAGK